MAEGDSGGFGGQEGSSASQARASSESEYVVRLEEVDRSSAGLVGSKAANIGEMIKAGLPVPPGFALTGKAFSRFLEAGNVRERINRILAAADTNDYESLESASRDITNLVMALHVPDLIRSEVRDAYEELSVGRDIKGVGGAALDMIKAGRGQMFVAVRSSLLDSANVPGLSAMLSPRLCVQGNEQLYHAIKQCWAGLFSAAAIFCIKDKMKERHADDGANGTDLASAFPAMGIVIQKMVDSEKAGALLTTGMFAGSSDISDGTVTRPDANNRMVVEAAWGYGDAVSAGLVMPDEYVIAKDTGAIESRRPGKKKWLRRLNPVSGIVVTENVSRDKVSSEVLAESELARLLELGRRVEEHWGAPQEVRWAFEKGRAFLVNAKPMQAIANYDTAVGAGGDANSNANSDGYGDEYIEKKTVDADKRHGKLLIEGSCASPGKATGTVRLVSGPEDINRMKSMEKGDILVTRMAMASMAPYMKKAGAIITNEGGRTCYAAVAAGELGIPCIVGADMATSALADGQKVFVDASIDANIEANGRGKVFEYVEQYPEQERKDEIQPDVQFDNDMKPENVDNQEYLASQARQPGLTTTAENSLACMPSMTASSEKITATGIMANITFPQSVDNNRGLVGRSDGAGLVRAEHIITESGKHPVFLARSEPESLVDAISAGLGRIAKAFYPKPVWYRCLDARTDEFRELEGAGEIDEQREDNPMLGWHGARRSIGEPVVFRCELRAIKRLKDDGLSNIAVMLPFVSRVEEVRKAKAIMNEVGLSVDSVGGRAFGIVVETPAAALEIEELCKEGIGFASINPNNLTQLTLGIDRENPRVSGMYSETDPAVMDLIRYVIRVCRKYNVETSICGEAASNPDIVDMLVGLGIGSISAEPDAVDEIRKAAARAERRMLLKKLQGN